MALSKLEKHDGHFVCPTCGGTLEFVEGGAVQVVDGKLDMEAAKSRYECGACNVFYREVMSTGFFDVFPLKKEAPKKEESVKKADNPCSKDPVALKKGSSGEYICPNCNKSMRFVEGGAVRVVDGKVDMESVKPTYECDECNVFYREVLSSGFYHAYPLDKKTVKKEAPKKEETVKKADNPCSKDPVALKKDASGDCICPNCNNSLRFVEGGAVRVVDGKVDMESVKPTYECDECNVFYREVLSSGFYHAYPLDKKTAKKEAPKKEVTKKEKKKVVSVGDLPPMALKRDANGQCECPRCGEMMNYVEGGAVTIVDGKPDMENVKARFVCDACHSVYRQIVNTEYYQWAEK